jgi:ABC-type antimicrobial peptide transport system permease subunit
MTRLGLQLTLRSGREALVRLILTAVAVAIGVTVLLAVFADYHAFQVTSRRPSWESTQATQGPVTSTANVELWNYSETIYKGQFIEVLDVAALGPRAPVVPGISKLPGPGQFFASPALATLLHSVPSTELGARFPGSQIGEIGQAALSGPQDLVAIVGYSPARLAALPNTIRVTRIATAAQLQGTTNLYRLAFRLGAIAILFPLLILITTATRLSAARREERYAAIRLAGGTPRQIGVIASVDATVAAVLGTLLGFGLFQLVRPAIATIAFSGAQFFPSYVTPTIWGYVAMLVLVPVGAAAASLVSLRRVQISPLGVARRTTPPAPSLWRVIPLLVGIPLFVFPVATHANDPHRIPLAPVWIGFLLVMVGLVLGGPWLTMQAARVMAKGSGRASPLLAARRLGDNPKAAFRSVSGLVLAVFVGTAIAVLAPAVNAAQSPTGDASLTNVLRAQYVPELSPRAAAGLFGELNAIRGASVLPIYANPAFPANVNLPPSPPDGGTGGKVIGRSGPGSGPSPGSSGSSYDSVIGCSSLERLPVLGTCPAGAADALLNAQTLFSDNPLFVYRSLPLVGPRTPAGPHTLAVLPLNALLIKVNDAATLERVRTVLTRFDATVPLGDVKAVGLSAWQMGQLEPETFGEVAQIRNNDDTNIERVVFAMLALTLLIAGCSLAVTVGGSIVERKRPFTLLRVSGAAASTLRRVVLLEALLPLFAASVVAAVVGVAVARPLVAALLPRYAHVAFPGPAYYLTLGAGLLVAVGVIMLTLPLLGRVTQPEKVRFE